MSFLKFSTNLFLEKLELDRFRDFLSDSGYKKHNFNIFTPGFVKSSTDELFLNAKVEQDINDTDSNTIRIKPILALDVLSNFIESREDTKIKIPTINTWYWIKLSHYYSNVERGIFSLDREGNLTSTDCQMTKIFRQLPNFPTKIKFVDSKNSQEYEILEVLDDNNAKLNGISFIEESNLRLKIVGTFTPGVIIPEADKYPFNFDSVQIELIEETELNLQPTHNEGFEFFIARLKVVDKQLIIQDKRKDFVRLKELKKQTPDINKLFGIESVQFSNFSGDNLSNKINIAWGMRSSNWSIDSSKNLVTVYGSSLGGRYKSVLDFEDGDFNKWRLYHLDGTYSKIYSSVKKGNAINLLVDVLDVDKFSKDGGLTFEEGFIFIAPDSDFIEIEIFDVNSTNNSYRSLLPINQQIFSQTVEIFQYPSCNYSVKYRYYDLQSNSDWFYPLSDESYGYYDEQSFDEFGKLKESGIVRKKYISSKVDNFIELLGYSKNFYYLREKLELNILEISDLVFDSEKLFVKLSSKIDNSYQVISDASFRNNPSSDTLFIDLSLSEEYSKNGSRFSLVVNKETNLNSKNIQVVDSFNEQEGSGNILKIISQRDVSHAKSNGCDLIIEFLYNGKKWICIQNYELNPIGELKIFRGVISEFFDGTGKGLYGGWLGYAICNGSNGTSNMSNLFVLEEGSSVAYKLVYAIKI